MGEKGGRMLPQFHPGRGCVSSQNHMHQSKYVDWTRSMTGVERGIRCMLGVGLYAVNVTHVRFYWITLKLSNVSLRYANEMVQKK